MSQEARDYEVLERGTGSTSSTGGTSRRSVVYDYINDSLYTRSCKQTSYISPGDEGHHIELCADQRDDGNIDGINTDGSGDVGDDDSKGGSCPDLDDCCHVKSEVMSGEEEEK